MKIPPHIWVVIAWALIADGVSRMLNTLRILYFLGLLWGIGYVAIRDGHFSRETWFKDALAGIVIVWKLGRWIRISTL
jgi:hypothetical protein